MNNLIEKKFIYSCKNGDISFVEKYIKDGHNLNVECDSWGYKAIYHAMKNNHIDIVKLLFKNKVRMKFEYLDTYVTSTNFDYSSGSRRSLPNKCKEMYKFILNKYISRRKKFDEEFEEAIDPFIKYHIFDIIKPALQVIIDNDLPCHEIISTAQTYRDIDVLDMFFDNNKTSLEKALFVAVCIGSIDHVKKYTNLKEFSDIDKDELSHFIKVAVDNKNVEITKLLLDKSGYKLFTEDHKDRFKIERSIINSDYDMFSMLLSYSKLSDEMLKDIKTLEDDKINKILQKNGY